jgi:homoserine kinase
MSAPFTRVRVPASSANLGPGFDALGLGLDVYLECRFRAASGLSIQASGRDAATISRADDNLIWNTAQRTATSVGRTMPAVELEIHNAIPLGKGLGSSAAALTAGVVMANEVLQLGWDAHRVLDEAARYEGHPDNVAACVLGGIVASAVDAEGRAQAVRMDVHPNYRVAVVVPDFTLPTAKAREVLPATYSRADAVFNVQRSALLIVALATGATSAFPTALEDRLHQPYRFPLVPGLDEIAKLRAPGLLGCALSGAGPSILVFHERGHEGVCEQVQAVFKAHGRDSEIICRDIAHSGYTVDRVTL